MSDFNLSKVAILIKTFLRDAYLFETIRAVQDTMPEVQMVIVDDGDQCDAKSLLYDSLRRQGHVVQVMPFDSGFGAKSNTGAALCDRPYLLIGSDDFNFRPTSVRKGVQLLARVLEFPGVAIASGRVNNVRYEGWLDDLGDRVIERYIDLGHAQEINGVLCHPCDLTVNYSMIRSSILGYGAGQIHWFNDIKIGGGEHGAFFVEAKRAGHKVVYVPGVDITEQSGLRTDLRYHTFRGRASQPGRLAFKKIGVLEYVLFDGTVERA